MGSRSVIANGTVTTHMLASPGLPMDPHGKYSCRGPGTWTSPSAPALPWP